MKKMIKIKIYKPPSGEPPYTKWLESLDPPTEARINIRMSRVKAGNFGDHEKIEGVKGLYELRMHFGPGYRVYFGKIKNTIILLLTGGIKRTQKKDIKKSTKYWEEYKEWKKKEK